jgi:cysteine-rich repeat protein
MRVLLGVLAMTLAASACRSGFESQCTPGTLACECTVNDACGDGLQCISGVCVGDEGGTTGGDGGDELCGNGAVDDDETCDLGASNSDNGLCTTDCQIAVCGDALLQLGVEPCDDGDADNTDTCTNICELPRCGDGWVQTDAGETCDLGDGNNGPEAACNDQCQEPACGDSVVGPGEECDNGGNNGPGELCNGECVQNVCGDSDPSPLETCDRRWLFTYLRV